MYSRALVEHGLELELAQRHHFAKTGKEHRCKQLSVSLTNYCISYRTTTRSYFTPPGVISGYGSSKIDGQVQPLAAMTLIASSRWRGMAWTPAGLARPSTITAIASTCLAKT